MAYKLAFDCTNNMVKYETLILGLKATILLKVHNINIYKGFQLIFNKVNGCLNIKDEKFIPYKDLVKYVLSTHFDKVQFENIPRNINKCVDMMTNVACLTPITIEYEYIIISKNGINNPSYIVYLDDTLKFPNTPRVNVCFMVPHETWYANIYKYLKDRTLLER